MSSTARPRSKANADRLATARRFRKIAEAPEPEPEPKPNGLPAHPFAVEDITIRNSKHEIIRHLDSVACRAWADYGLKGTP